MQSALEWIEREEDLGNLAVFLDFDGTLAPIVDRPGDAKPLKGISRLVEELAQIVPVAVISGRGLADVQKRLGAQGIYYAGSHGMEIVTPEGEHHEAPEVEKILEVLDEQEQWLYERLSGLRGVEIERKRFGVAVHFRRNRSAQDEVEQILAEAVDKGRGLKVGTGKMVRELQPDVDWNKGTALRFIFSRMNEEKRRPLYIGDDRTDEDAFEEIQPEGVGILVAEEERETAAQFRVRDPKEVRSFLRRLVSKR